VVFFRGVRGRRLALAQFLNDRQPLNKLLAQMRLVRFRYRAWLGDFRLALGALSTEDVDLVASILKLCDVRLWYKV
jgi:hypothetical protein